MEITESTVYWITRMDGIHDFSNRFMHYYQYSGGIKPYHIIFDFYGL